MAHAWRSSSVSVDVVLRTLLSKVRTGMAEETTNGSSPDLKELEDKVGMKTPERLVMWMRDAAHCEGWSSVTDSGNTISHQINSLRQEMRWLRSADVRILRQLLTVHEGTEAMRWLMEERSNLASLGSSLTGSLSSLVTMDEPFTSSCRRKSKMVIVLLVHRALKKSVM
ncbi:leucine rich adaptor protein 1-like [Thalassophryne amazonica]|uniref:leucine rich adaptor protein 1-like n=1 Tax=Thalassophryne amazonica TaxID=390379 RepID=UPI001471CFAF|nr:leucine rich adaptor protein 1-like [Thalassophryne amazonica]